MLDGANIIRKLMHHAHRDEKGILNVTPSTEEYFGFDMHTAGRPGITAFDQAHSQMFSMELYESRIASLQRFVALCVMFHHMGKRVQDFFGRYSCGIFSYKMNRTHSIMRIATTASPVSGDAVRDQMDHLRIKAAFQNAVNRIVNAWNKKQKILIKDLKELHMSNRSLTESFRSARNLNDDTASPALQISARSLVDPGSSPLLSPQSPAAGNRSHMIDFSGGVKKMPEMLILESDDKATKEKTT
jgi:hypothetical protein